MGSVPCEGGAGPVGTPDEPVTLKILVSGGFGAGKTTFVGAVSEIRPLRTEELLSEVGRDHDDTRWVETKRSTTVAMDFGRITLNESLVLYLFGTPGQERFWFHWDELVRGALGAVVLVDTRRLADSFAGIDFFEGRHVPFVVAVNRFEGAARHSTPEIREALDLDPRVPIVQGDAREPDSVRETLVAVVEHAMRRSIERRDGQPAAT